MALGNQHFKNLFEKFNIVPLSCLPEPLWPALQNPYKIVKQNKSHLAFQDNLVAHQKNHHKDNRIQLPNLHHARKGKQIKNC